MLALAFLVLISFVCAVDKIAPASSSTLSYEASLQLQCIQLKNHFAHDPCTTIALTTSSCLVELNVACTGQSDCDDAIAKMESPCLMKAEDSKVGKCRAIVRPECTPQQRQHEQYHQQQSNSASLLATMGSTAVVIQSLLALLTE
jgi:hypothetical protein